MLYEYIVLLFFLWTLSTIASSLLVLQAESVEYMIKLNFYRFIKTFRSPGLFQVFGPYFKSNRDFKYFNGIHSNVLVIRNLWILL